ncbi:CP089 protein, partial [Pseudoatta argentina]
METRVPGFSSILKILLFACFSLRTEAAFNPESFQQKLIALQKVLDYMNNRPEQMNLDAAFGVTLTEANLVAALLHENVQYLEDKFFIALKEMVVLSDLTRKHLMKIIAPKNETKFLMLSTLNNPNQWIKPISWTKVFSKSRSHPQLLNYQQVVRSIWHGTPTETESDQCLIEIMRSSLKEECEIPVTCVATLIKEDDTTGYPLTHRLLIVQVAKVLGCEEIIDKTALLSSLVSTYCTRIFQDLINLEAWNFPNVTRDLMLEQGNGYYEFVDKHYEDIILSWPHWSGCFAKNIVNECYVKCFRLSNEHQITRRSSSITDFGCDNHTTSLAAASLAVFIRENIENALSQP